MGLGKWVLSTGVTITRRQIAKRRARKECLACGKKISKGNMCRKYDCQVFGIKHPEIFDVSPSNDDE